MICLVFVTLLFMTLVTPVLALDDENPGVSSFDIVNAACEYYGIDIQRCTTNDVANYFADHPYLISELYSVLNPQGDPSFAVAYIEHMIPVEIVTLQETGVYLDFDGNKGYMVLTNVSEIVALEFAGDLEYLKTLNSTYYSLVDGFLYNMGSQYVAYEARSFSNATDEPLMMEQYDGQESPGDGEIVGATAYVADRYGAGYTFAAEDNRNLANFSYVAQNDLSLYFETKSDGLTYGEGNCTLSSIYALMNYLQSSGQCPNLPSGSNKLIYDPSSSDPFYSKYKAKSNYSIKGPTELPVLYLLIRKQAIDDYGYETSGTNPFNIKNIIESVAEFKNSSITASHWIAVNFENDILKEIREGRPVIINIALSQTYGSHSMVVTGYRTYKKNTVVLGITFTKYVYLLRVNDNWHTSYRYFDYTAFSGTISCVTVKVG